MGRRRRVALRPRADLDIDQQFEYLAIEAGTQTARRFLAGVRATLERLAADPEIGSPRRFSGSALAGLRIWPVRGFRRHLLFYRPLVDDEGIEVVRLLHAARDIESLLDG